MSNIQNCYKSNGIVFFKNHTVPPKWIVLRKMKVKPHTFAGDMVSRSYDFYFSNAIRLKEEYRRYYRKEYVSLECFISEHYNIDSQIAHELAEGDYWMKDCKNAIDRCCETLKDDETFASSFSSVIGGFVDEDSDRLYY